MLQYEVVLCHNYLLDLDQLHFDKEFELTLLSLQMLQLLVVSSHSSILNLGQLYFDKEFLLTL